MIKRTHAFPLLVAACAAALGDLAPGSLSAQETGASRAPLVRTSGRGEVTLEPDRAVLEFGIQLVGASAEALLTEVAGVRATLLDTLTSLGVPADSLEIDRLRAHPRWTGDASNRQREYYIAASIRFRTGDPEQVPELIEAALAAGVSQSSGVRWESSEVEEARAEALRLAFEAARRDAEALAEAAGGRLGALVEVSTTGGPAMERFAMEAVSLERPAARTPVGPVPQPVVVQQSVVASWRLETP